MVLHLVCRVDGSVKLEKRLIIKIEEDEEGRWAGAESLFPWL